MSDISDINYFQYIVALLYLQFELQFYTIVITVVYTTVYTTIYSI